MDSSSEEPHGNVGSGVAIDRLPSHQSERGDRGGPEALARFSTIWVGSVLPVECVDDVPSVARKSAVFPLWHC